MSSQLSVLVVFCSQSLCLCSLSLGEWWSNECSPRPQWLSLTCKTQVNEDLVCPWSLLNIFIAILRVFPSCGMLKVREEASYHLYLAATFCLDCGSSDGCWLLSTCSVCCAVMVMAFFLWTVRPSLWAAVVTWWDLVCGVVKSLSAGAKVPLGFLELLLVSLVLCSSSSRHILHVPSLF